MLEIGSSIAHRVASQLYSAGISLRNFAFDHGLLASSPGELPCICLGNVVVGGSGKTPFAQFVAKALLEQGQHPAIVLRGYKGSYKEPQILSASPDPAVVGDEAALHRLLLPQEIPIAVARNRHEGIALLQSETTATIVLLDDGLQHRRLSCDANVVLLNATTPAAISRWRDGELLPLGYLREPLSNVIERSHCVIYTFRQSSEGAIQKPECDFGTLPKLAFVLRPTHFIDAFDGSSASLQSLRKQPCDAAAAIATPEAFFTSLTELGIELREQHAYADHQEFGKETRTALLHERKRPLLITEKDGVKLRRYVDRPGIVYMLAANGSFASEADELTFWQCLEQQLASRQAPTE